jgi:hypothetical protein
MWEMPRDQLWMSMPYWERLTEAHASLLDAEGLRLWMAILANNAGEEKYPISRLFFLPDETTSSLKCVEVAEGAADFAGVARTSAHLQGEWLGQFEREVLSLGQGTATLDIVESPEDASGFGEAQRGYVEFGPTVHAHGFITKSSVKNFFELAGMTVFSRGAMLELSFLLPLNGWPEGTASQMYGPRGAVGYGQVALSTPRTAASVALGRPALLLSGFGNQKIRVVRLLMRDLGICAGEVTQRMGALEQPFPIAVAGPDELEAILNLADEYAEAGATLKFAVLPGNG